MSNESKTPEGAKPEEKPVAPAKKARPEPGTYNTFTSRKKATTICMQKPRYGKDEFQVRRLVDDKVTITLQHGVQFDAYRECLGDSKGFKGNPYFVKMVSDGYLKAGVRVKLDPETLQRFLDANAGDEVGTNAIILWQDRKRPEKEIELEGIIEGHVKVTKKQAAEIERMKALLKKANIPFEAKV